MTLTGFSCLYTFKGIFVQNNIFSSLLLQEVSFINYFCSKSKISIVGEAQLIFIGG